MFITYDDDENGVPRVYESVYGLLSGADEAAAQCPNDPDLEVNANSFDWLEGLANMPGTRDADIEWFAGGPSPRMLTEATGKPRAPHRPKVDGRSARSRGLAYRHHWHFYTMVGAGQGGQVA